MNNRSQRNENCFEFGSLESVELFRTWLQHCMANHMHCKNKQSTFSWPSRLIHISSKASTPKAVSAEHVGECVHYVALSHCWGQYMPLKLLRSNMNDLNNDIPFEMLPKTFQDAILMIQHLVFHIYGLTRCVSFRIRISIG
jgi:hypothetical protein